MTSIQLKRWAVGAALLAGASLASGGAYAQGGVYPSGPTVQPYREDPAAALTRHLRDLNSSPRSLTSLLGAGQAALDVGDPQAALTFFARAEEVAPRDGRVKAGMGSAFVQTEQAQPALRFFAEAVASGAPLSSFVKDRGLAYDMIGDPARAQADYALALQRGSDPEVERRLALSKAITGDQKGALAVLDRQLRRGDRAGWRARAFVLALTGDSAGAVQAARSVMPAQAGAMGPFFARLPQLSAAERAMAVHFGRFPANWRSSPVPNAQYAQNQAVMPTTTGRPDPSQPALGAPPPAAAPVQARNSQTARQSTQTSAPVRRPRFRERWEPYEPTPRPRQTAPATAQSAPAAVPVAAAPAPVVTTQAAPPPAAWAAPVQTYAPPPAAQPQVQAAPVQTYAPPAAAQPQVQGTPVQPAPVLAAPVPAAPVQVPAAQPAPSDSFDFKDVVATVQSLPAGTSAPAQRPVQLAEASKPRTAAPKPAAAKPAAAKEEAKPAPEKKAEPAKPREPSRLWVQLAVAQDKSAFPGEFKRLKGKAPELLSGKSAWTAPMGKTNRLLVGPFKTEKEAREFVNQLSKEEISSFTWESDEGQKIDKLPAK